MKRIIVTKDSVEIQREVFQTQEDLDAWVAYQKSLGVRCPWGRPAWTETLEDQSTVEHPDEFSIEVVDCTAEYALKDAKASLDANRKFGLGLIDEFAVENVLLGITDQQSDSVLLALGSTLLALSNGYLGTAIRRVKELDPNTFDGTFLSEARLLQYVNRIETHLGISLSDHLYGP